MKSAVRLRPLLAPAQERVECPGLPAIAFESCPFSQYKMTPLCRVWQIFGPFLLGHLTGVLTGAGAMMTGATATAAAGAMTTGAGAWGTGAACMGAWAGAATSAATGATA